MSLIWADFVGMEWKRTLPLDPSAYVTTFQVDMEKFGKAKGAST
jgi:hypothetical protein